MSKIKLIAMDLDGTLTQHKTPIEPQNKAALIALSRKYKLLLVGAGGVGRIHNQLDGLPVDIVGNYGLQYGEYKDNEMHILRDLTFACDKKTIEEKINFLRNKYGFCDFTGESVEYHPSGCVTFPILGTRAAQADKLSFDPDRAKRRRIYAEVCDLFPDYCVFVGGSSSFDMAPRPYNKYHALADYCSEKGYSHDEVVYIGDDYGMGGNDEAVYKSEFTFLKIDNYTDFPNVIARLL